MPRALGDDGVLLIGAQAVSLIRSWTYREEGDPVPMPAMGDTNKINLAGKPTIDGTVTMWMDDDDAGQVLVVQGDNVTLELRQLGTGSGLPEYTVTADITSFEESVEVEAGIERTFGWTATAAVDKTDQV